MRACFVLLLVIGCVYADQKCQGSPRMFNGKKCASTTNYVDFHKGACGCGPDNGDNQYDWNHSGLVAAASQHLYDAGNSAWCGQNCGKCVKLTTTGGSVPGQGKNAPVGQSHVFMITNLCPNVYPNLSWCSQSPGNHYMNQYGYGEHFDLENGIGQITGTLQWTNPEVTWEWTDCNAAHGHDGRTPNLGMYHQCYCGKQGKK